LLFQIKNNGVFDKRLNRKSEDEETVPCKCGQLEKSMEPYVAQSGNLSIIILMDRYV
jgi:hypothetical protein